MSNNRPATFTHTVPSKILYSSFLILFVLSFFLVRWPAYSTNLVGEDGTFADIFLNRVAGPDYFQVGRVLGNGISYLIDPFNYLMGWG